MIGVANDVTELHDGVLWYARTDIGIVVLFSPCIKWCADSFGSSIPSRHVFVWDYGEAGKAGRFVTRSSFDRTGSRHYCAD